MKIQSGQFAVVTGGASGIGRQLVVQLCSLGVHVAACDVSQEGLQETADLAKSVTNASRVALFRADVSVESELAEFRKFVQSELATDHIHLLFNNAGIGGGGGFVSGSRAEWERTFGIDWWGVYYGCRVFMPMLLKAPEGFIVNTSSVNGFWASLGPDTSHTAYAAAKFAVKGFTEALITDLRLNAPHLRCAVVMPGHIGTSIALNTSVVLGQGSVEAMPAERLALIRQRLARQNPGAATLPDEALRKIVLQRATEFRDNAPTSAAQAAKVILDGVRADQWRILVGEDAARLDRLVRENPEMAYEPGFAQAWRDGRSTL